MPKVFIPLLAMAATFIWFTGGAMPPVVASHFAASGVANGFMPRGSYVAIMLGATIVAPVLVALSGSLTRILPVQLINLPHRQYWLAPQRRAATVASLAALSVHFASALVIFLCFVHWLVVKANAAQPPHLEQAPFFAGLALFVVAVALWFIYLLGRFRNVRT